jgi:hypothetical protein
MEPVRHTGKPRWDSVAQQLILDGKVCKTWSREALNQWGILKAFEEAEWRSRVENLRSLKGSPLEDESLRETVRELNKRLRYIRFACDGTGKGVTWSLTRKGRRKGTPRKKGKRKGA